MVDFDFVSINYLAIVSMIYSKSIIFGIMIILNMMLEPNQRVIRSSLEMIDNMFN